VVSLADRKEGRLQTEHQLLNQKIGFSAAYLAVQYLFSHIKKIPESITEQTVTALLMLIQSNRFAAKRQAYFLYKETACALIHLSTDATHPLTGFSIFKLQELLLSSHGKKHRAVSEALGSLPLTITGPDIQEIDLNDRLEVSFDTVLHQWGNTDISTFHWHGRTLRGEMPNGRIACIKFARSKESGADLIMESHWLNFLRDHPPCRQSTFKIPIPVCINNTALFKLTHLPNVILENPHISKEYLAIVFIAEKDYFFYPNTPDFFKNQSGIVKEIFSRNAWLLGKLTSKGIIHTALIPLFHNRVQQSRRDDHGIYVWEQGGRLDKWLESSRFPNFAKSGLRDFEHLIAIKDTKRLHHFIGEHILGFVLVLGSFFRNKAPERIGWDENGHPVDTRSLFDRSLFSELFQDIVRLYYQGMTGVPLKTINRFFDDRLIDRLIETMGMDHHMEETLRIRDQEIMTETDFHDFLISRGYETSLLTHIKKGEQDIVLNTGPHLGGFNQPISVPELMEFLFCLSSLCISDRYLMENGLKASLN
jgi:hypothetical protein